MAKVLRIGAGQAEQLPKEFHFEADEVGIKQIGAAVLLHPKETEWDLMESAVGAVDDDFLPRREQPRKRERRRHL